MNDGPAVEWAAKHPVGTEIVAAIYARRSLGQTETYSPDAQVAACKKACQDRGWKIRYVIVEDDAVADFYRRPKWLILMLKAIQKKFHVLVTWKMDRWARSMWDTLRTEQFLARHGIAFTSATEPLDTTTQIGRFSFRNLANFAELERGMIAERTKMGYRAKMRMLRWPGHRAPLGYRTRGSLIKPPARDYRLEVAPEDRELIELVWTKFQACLSGPEVATQLNDEGRATKWGGHWTDLLVYRAIDNPLYVGKWTRGGVEQQVDSLRIMSDNEYAARQALRHRRVIRKPPISENRRRAAIENVFRQYHAQLEVDGLQEAAHQVDVVAGLGDDRLDPALVKRIMGQAEERIDPGNYDEARRRRNDLRWRKDLAEVLTL